MKSDKVLFCLPVSHGMVAGVWRPVSCITPATDRCFSQMAVLDIVLVWHCWLSTIQHPNRTATQVSMVWTTIWAHWRFNVLQRLWNFTFLHSTDINIIRRKREKKNTTWQQSWTGFWAKVCPTGWRRGKDSCGTPSQDFVGLKTLCWKVALIQFPQYFHF